MVHLFHNSTTQKVFPTSFYYYNEYLHTCIVGFRSSSFKYHMYYILKKPILLTTLNVKYVKQLSLFGDGEAAYGYYPSSTPLYIITRKLVFSDGGADGRADAMKKLQAFFINFCIHFILFYFSFSCS